MSLPKDEAWFRAKSCGYGWGFPARWQGWVVIVSYMIAVCVVGLWFTTHPARVVACIIAFSLVLVAFHVWKGEPAKWRWGRSDDGRDS
jgi:hypothetical protein